MLIIATGVVMMACYDSGVVVIAVEIVNLDGRDRSNQLLGPTQTRFRASFTTLCRYVLM